MLDGCQLPVSETWRKSLFNGCWELHEQAMLKTARIWCSFSLGVVQLWAWHYVARRPLLRSPRTSHRKRHMPSSRSSARRPADELFMREIWPFLRC
jgi:hypothetical protein